MKKDLQYITIDGRGDHDSFRDTITQTIKDLKPDQGIHVIKDFEPFPMYKMMESKGFDKYVEKISDDEFHVYFTPLVDLKEIKMGKFLEHDNKRIKKMINIIIDYLKNETSLEAAKKEMNDSFDKVTAQEFAICEQYLHNYGVSDTEIEEEIDEILNIFGDVLVSNRPELPSGHPIRTYMDEVKAIRKILTEMGKMLEEKFIKNHWTELYDRLAQIKIHFARKENQLFPALEKKGFDKPSKMMWSLDNDIRDTFNKARVYLDNDQNKEFLKLQNEVIAMIEDMMVKEEEILMPTAIDLLSDEDFIEMSNGDYEIGFCLIADPPHYGTKKEWNNQSEKENGFMKNNEFIKDLTALIQRHGVLTEQSGDNLLDVSEGKLTLEQINLIFKHLKIDLSFVDENNLVKFYSDTPERVFPRSPGVIGREVQNCHPRESVDKVEEIVEAFKAGEHNQAEFWLEMNGKFLYIVYTAVRDEKGNYKGVLEMMQDVTHIRSLKGSQRLLSWNTDNNE